MTSIDNLTCSFCKRQMAEKQFVKSEEKIVICDDCIYAAYKYMFDRKHDKQEDVSESLSGIHEIDLIYIKEQLDKHIIGHDQAKVNLISLLSYHFWKILNNSADQYIQKQNVLVLGSTGTGKTFIMKQLLKLVNIPYAVIDATTLTQTGYIGEDVDSIATQLIESAKGDIELAQKGVVVIDEIDKLCSPKKRTNINEVTGLGVQFELLKFMEERTVFVAPTSQTNKMTFMCKKVAFYTGDLTYFCLGAFDGLEEELNALTDTYNVNLADAYQERIMKLNPTVEYTDEKQKNHMFHLNNALVNLGMLPELLGRLGNIIILNDLSITEMKDILTKSPYSVIANYQKFYSKFHINLSVSDDALEYMIKEANKLKLGIRGVNKLFSLFLFKEVNNHIFNYLQGKTEGEPVSILLNYHVDKGLHIIVMPSISSC